MPDPAYTYHDVRPFLDALEQLKLVERRNRVVNRSRFENSAEHSWNVALMAHVCGAFAPKGTDLHRAVLMLLVHDVVEIYAGDTWAYAPESGSDAVQQREHAAAEKLFATLPANLHAEFFGLWREFSERETPTARYAAAIDALQPLHNHSLSGGFAPGEPRPTREHVLARKAVIADASPELWEFALELIESNVAKGTFTS